MCYRALDVGCEVSAEGCGWVGVEGCCEVWRQAGQHAHRWPLRAARCSGVLPASSRGLTSSAVRMSSCSSCASPNWAAQCSAVFPAWHQAKTSKYGHVCCQGADREQTHSAADWPQTPGPACREACSTLVEARVQVASGSIQENDDSSSMTFVSLAVMQGEDCR